MQCTEDPFAIDIMKQMRAEQQQYRQELDEKDDDTVLNELTFPEFFEALYEFTVLKVRASILSKKNAEESSDKKNYII